MGKKSVVTLAFLALIVVCFFVYTEKQTHSTAENIVKSDYADHPIYSSYEFSSSDSVIQIGLQPLYFPGNMIFEVVKRDTILASELNKLGLEIRFFSFLKGNDVNYYLRNGDLDGGIGGDMPALTIAATADVIIPTMVQQGVTSIVATRQMLIEELRGQRIGFAFGSNAHFTVLEALASEGMTFDDIIPVAMEVNEMIQALETGQIVAFSSWEPMPTVALITNPEFVAIHRNLSTGFLYFSRQFSDEHPIAVRHIIAAQVRALRLLRGNPGIAKMAFDWSVQESERVTPQSHPKISETIVESLIGSDLLGAKSPPFIAERDIENNGSLHKEFQFLKQYGFIPAESDWEQVQQSFDRELLTEVLSDPVRYSLHIPVVALGAKE